MPAGTFTPIQYLPPYGYGAPGNANTQAGGGGMGPYFRDAIDARRSMYNATPEAMYPDGYLGTINTRRGDRLLDSLKNRQNQRSYQRGVHKGERIDPADYYFPPGLELDVGIRLQAEGKSWVLLGGDVPQYSPRQEVMQGADPGLGQRSEQLRRLAPPWR